MRMPHVDARTDFKTGEPLFKITREGTSAYILLNSDELFELANQAVSALEAYRNDHTNR